MGFLIALLGPLGDFLLKLWQGRGPPQEVVEAEKAGAAEQDVKQMEANDAVVSKGAVARDAVARADVGGGLSNNEAADPDCRDCKT